MKWRGQSFADNEDNDTVDSKNVSMVVVHPRMLETKFAMLALALASCSSKSTTPPQGPPPTMTCNDLACIEANEGQIIQLEGVFAFPRDPSRKGTSQYKLALSDGVEVVLKRDESLTPALDGRRIVVRGKVYANPANIPDEYGIIQSTPNPYLVELHAVTAR